MYLILHEGRERKPFILRSNTILLVVTTATAPVPEDEMLEGQWNEKAWVTVSFVPPDSARYVGIPRDTEDIPVCETVEEIAQLLHAQGTLELP